MSVSSFIFQKINLTTIALIRLDREDPYLAIILLTQLN